MDEGNLPARLPQTAVPARDAVGAEDAPPAAERCPLPGPLAALIERWWEDHFPGSAVARDTQAWNVAHAAKETLKRLLQKG